MGEMCPMAGGPIRSFCPPCPPHSQLWTGSEGPGLQPRSGPVSWGHSAPELAQQQHQLKVITINSSAW
eukprot:2339922-Heterocapsa_arctica.AAC.1